MIQKHENTNQIVCEILKFVKNNMPCRLTVSKIAKEFSYSVSYVSHLFKKETGVSLQYHIIMQKISYARFLLSDNNITLREVASKCGYKSVPSFCKLYKKYTGTTPFQKKSCQSGWFCGVKYEKNLTVASDLLYK